jgi:SAM-dependent methyltransferase
VQKDYIERAVTTDGIHNPASRLWAEKWAQTTLPNPDSARTREEWRQLEKWLMTLKQPARVLDGGCGLGEWTVALHRQGFGVAAVDVAADLLARVEGEYHLGRFSCSDIRALCFRTATFDCYFSWGAFEHFEEGLGPCVSEARRVLRPGGLLLVSVPFQNWRHQIRSAFASTRASSGRDLVFYQWRLTPSELKRQLEIEGFRVMEIRTMAKEHGIHRILQGLLGQRLALWVPVKIVRRLLSFVVPGRLVAHMILAVAVREP